MRIKSLTIAALSALALFAGAAGSAEAGGRHHGGFHSFHHFNDFHRQPRFRLTIGGGGGGGCRYFYEQWRYTGDFYWKRRFDECRYYR